MNPRLFNSMGFAVLVLMGFASAAALSGRVVNPGAALSGKAGVSVGLAGTTLITQTDAQGYWSLSGVTGIIHPDFATHRKLTPHLASEQGRLCFVLNGYDLLGRGQNLRRMDARFSEESAARFAATIPDTVVYSLNGKVFLRDTLTNLVQSGMVRVFDTFSNSSIAYGYLRDSRDGQVYRTVKIGTQVWMAQNLNFAVDSSWWVHDRDLSTPDPNAPGQFDTTNDILNMGAKYGRLYNWKSVLGLNDTCATKTCTSQILGVNHGICPSGWHVPKDSEWTVLVNFVEADPRVGRRKAGKYLVASIGWYSGVVNTGGDLFGFSALPAGFRDDKGSPSGPGAQASWWTASEYGGSLGMGRSTGAADVRLDGNLKSYGFSLRCIQD